MKILDEQKLVEYITDNSDIPAEVIRRVLDLELEYLVKVGIAK
jgi:hypothetical protein